MKSLSLSHNLLACASALVLTLLAGPVTASALQIAKPAATAPATAKPGLHTLTPTAPVPSPNGASSEGDIRDIRQPRHLPTIPPWAAVAVGVVLFGAVAFARRLFGRRGKFLQMLPHEIALQSLEEARQLMNPERAREYCFAASNIIRRYVEDRFHVHAPRLTTEEFLRDLVELRDTMLEPHRALLGQFLEHCDLAKFADWRYSMPDLESMHATARTFVQQTAVAAATPTAPAAHLHPAATTIDRLSPKPAQSITLSQPLSNMSLSLQSTSKSVFGTPTI
jgi:hypothetical protein